MEVGKSLAEKEFDMWWADFAGPPYVTTHLGGDTTPTDLECTHLKNPRIRGAIRADVYFK